ncbi:efflux RND transporter periplasmic adaptor subunit [Lichenihabitans psoromatis]|uniref:efflux RND transporter periplasmic adaptor subunit n=1 Tax=Lichenihabitans psoromatis TaxID=2528642 RepID=UPI0010384173|nr:efflux RND transporter periplasmic adaptor subunit [Lichenihabitans psoromatis]
MISRWPIAIVVAAAVLPALALSLPALAAEAAINPPSAPTTDLAPAVTVAKATTRDVVEQTIVTGTLVPRDEVLVLPEVDGYRITDVLVEEGMTVTRGQVLARLSREMLDRQIAQQVAAIEKATATVTQADSNIIQAEAENTEAKLALDRARLLMQTGNSTAAVMESRTAAARSAEGRLAFARNGLNIAKADLAQSKAAQDELDLKLARTDIRAPVDGIISRKVARLGATASSSGDALFRIIARGEIELEGEVIETRLPSLRLNAPALLDIDGGDPVHGVVRAIYPEVDKTTRLGTIRISLDPDPRLHIGAFARGTVELARKRSVAVPLSAVLYGAGGGSSVLVVRADDHVEARPIRTGLVDDTYVAVLNGLKEGDRVVARAGSFLRDGDRIKPVAAPEPALNSASAAPTP